MLGEGAFTGVQRFHQVCKGKHQYIDNQQFARLVPTAQGQRFLFLLYFSSFLEY